MVFKDYLLQNWPLILVLLAFIVSLATTVFLQKKIVVRTYVLIAFIFILSIVVFLEFYFSGKVEYKSIRLVLTAIRYSATPIIIAQIIVTLVKRVQGMLSTRWIASMPAENLPASSHSTSRDGAAMMMPYLPIPSTAAVASEPAVSAITFPQTCCTRDAAFFP